MRTVINHFLKNGIVIESCNSSSSPAPLCLIPAEAIWRGKIRSVTSIEVYICGVRKPEALSSKMIPVHPIEGTRSLARTESSCKGIGCRGKSSNNKGSVGSGGKCSHKHPRTISTQTGVQLCTVGLLRIACLWNERVGRKRSESKRKNIYIIASKQPTSPVGTRCKIWR